MFESFSRRFNGAPVYIQLTTSQISITDTVSEKQIVGSPEIAISTEGRSQKVVAFGQKAHLQTGPGIRVVNGFQHPRSIIANFVYAEKVLQHYMAQIPSTLSLKLRPIVIIHPKEKLEGGLTQIEVRALKELAIGAGARKAFVWVGRDLTIDELSKGSYPEEGWLEGKPD